MESGADYIRFNATIEAGLNTDKLLDIPLHCWTSHTHAEKQRGREREARARRLRFASALLPLSFRLASARMRKNGVAGPENVTWSAIGKSSFVHDLLSFEK